MSIGTHAGNPKAPRVKNAESMYRTIMELGIIPFFENPIHGYSIEEMTPGEFWFDEGELGPWDWKIECVRSGDIAYGKFLWGGKASFATVPLYRELANWRRSLPAYQPNEIQRKVLDLVNRDGSAGIKDIRQLLGVKKSIADGIVTRLQMQTRLVTGDIARVYRGADLHYNGWQTSSFCPPDTLFASEGMDFGPFKAKGVPFEVDHSPAESLEILVSHISKVAPEATESQILKMLK